MSVKLSSATDGGGSKQNRVRTANSQLKNEHGRSFFSVPAVNLCSRLVSILSICKKANGKRLFRTDKDVGGSIQKRDDMFLIAGKCGTLIRRDRGAGSRLLANARKS